MSKKFCPLGFFSFYVNKSKAEAGGGHHCVEENCALWNDEYEDCSLKIGLDSLTVLADNFGSGQRMPIPERRVVEVEAPKLSIFDKLRRKTEGQRLPTIETPTNDVAPIITPLTVSPPATTSPPPAPPPTPTLTTTEELLRPPDVPLDALPIISITSKEN